LAWRPYPCGISRSGKDLTPHDQDETTTTNCFPCQEPGDASWCADAGMNTGAQPPQKALGAKPAGPESKATVETISSKGERSGGRRMTTPTSVIRREQFGNLRTPSLVRRASYYEIRFKPGLDQAQNCRQVSQSRVDFKSVGSKKRAEWHVLSSKMAASEGTGPPTPSLTKEFIREFSRLRLRTSRRGLGNPGAKRDLLRDQGFGRKRFVTLSFGGLCGYADLRMSYRVTTA
jgi:hypothetical protein